MLILKVYLKYYDIILRLIAFLGETAASIHIIQSYGSTWDGEVYIVAVHGVDFTGNYSALKRMYPPSLRIRAFNNYWMEYNEQFHAEQRKPDSIKVMTLPAGLVRSLCRHLPSYGWNQLESVIRTGFPNYRLRKRQNETTEALIMRILGVIEKLSAPLKSELQDDVCLDRSEFAVLYLTATHRFEML